MRTISILCLALALLAGCTSDRQRRVETIQHNDSLLFLSGSNLDKKLAMDQVHACREFAEKYPKDTLAPEFLFKGADLANGLQQGAEAIAMLQTLRKNYPEHRRAGTALFMIAFFYETTLHDPKQAMPAYEEFLRKYPDHRLAQAAEFSLQQLQQGMTPEDVVKMYEARADSSKAPQ